MGRSRAKRPAEEPLATETSDKPVEEKATKRRKKQIKNSPIEPEQEGEDKSVANQSEKQVTSKSGRASRRSIACRPIPDSYETASDLDKALVDKRAQNASWADLRKFWLEQTGEKTATSTLPNRYARLMLAFARIPDEDKGLMLTAKREVDKVWEKGKWRAVAALIVEKGGGEHEADLLQRVYRKMMLEHGLKIPEDVYHPDLGQEGADGSEDENNESSDEEDADQDSEEDA